MTRRKQDGNKHMRCLESCALTPALVSHSSYFHVNFRGKAFGVGWLGFALVTDSSVTKINRCG